MAENEGIATKQQNLYAQLKEVIEIFHISPESRPIFTRSTLRGFEEALSKTTRDLKSYSQLG